MHSVIISPSLLSADFARAGEQLDALRAAGATHLHLDVMDGLFVPNISFGVPVIRSLRKSTDLFFDVHLMIDRPERYLRQFAEAGADAITIHSEATERPAEVLERIRSMGLQAAVSIKPGTPVREIEPFLRLCDRVLVMSVEPGFGGQSFLYGSLEKIRSLAAMKDLFSYSYEIQVDGGIDESTAILCAEAGAENLVAGSSVFGKPDPAEAYLRLCDSVKEVGYGE
ncbi:MAG: ribulose-phosphate 3-epimerase [Clostridia bacterium]|nr:ribulose-phosphate 3-epimerase [Clostridia bacterium]